MIGNLLRYTPAAILISAVAATNLQYAWTLGTTPPTRAIMLAYSIATTLGTALGPELIASNWRNKRRLRCAAALILFTICLGYDAFTAKGFATRQHTVAEDTSSDQNRRRADAQAHVKRLNIDLARYADAGDPTVARAEADALTDRIDQIDARPGVIHRGKPCSRLRDDDVKAWCAQREKLAADLIKAQTATARAEAKQRLQLELAAAQKTLDAIPIVPPADPRAKLIGSWAVEWLPVALALAAALSVFAIPPRITQDGRLSSPGPGIPADPQITASGQPRRRKGQAGKGAVAQRIAQLSQQPTNGLLVDRDGYLRGSQRNLARAAGYGSNVSAFNRDLHAAADAGELQLDLQNGTAIKSKITV